MKFKIEPTLRVKFPRSFTEEAHDQLIAKAEEYGSHLTYSAGDSAKGRILYTVFGFDNPEKSKEFESSVAKRAGKIKPALALSCKPYTGDSNDFDKLGNLLNIFAILFGGTPLIAVYDPNKGECSFAFSFSSKFLCKAYAICMKLL